MDSCIICYNIECTCLVGLEDKEDSQIETLKEIEKGDRG